MTRKFSWLPDVPDFRDFKVRGNFKLVPLKAVPTSIDLRPYCSAVEDQGELGSCTGNAIAGAIELLENKYSIDTNQGIFTDLSRLFIYYNERWIEGTVSEDSGASIRDGIKSLAKWGVCMESLWPYKEESFTTKPSDACYTDGALRKISMYARVTQITKSIRNVLASGYPIIFGFAVYSNFISDKVSNTGILDLPTRKDEFLGGHAVLCVGYNDKTSRVIVRNSWGSGWGQKGYFTMPYSYIVNNNLAADLWVVKK